MKLIPCPECGRQISVNATKCVHCGFPLPLKTCPECGAQYNAVLSVCPQCGYDEVAAKEQAERLAKQQAELARIATEQHAIKVAKAKRIGKIVAIVLAIITMIGLLVGSVIFFTKKHAEDLSENIGGLVVRGDFLTASDESTALMNEWWCPKEIQTECRTCINKMKTFEEQILIGDSLFSIGDYDDAKKSYDVCMHITSNRNNIRQKMKSATECAELIDRIWSLQGEHDYDQAHILAEQLYEKHSIERNKRRIDDVEDAARSFAEEEKRRAEQKAREDALYWEEWDDI